MGEGFKEECSWAHGRAARVCGEGFNSRAELWRGCHWSEQLGRVVGRVSLEGSAGRSCGEGVTGGNSWAELWGGCHWR